MAAASLTAAGQEVLVSKLPKDQNATLTLQIQDVNEDMTGAQIELWLSSNDGEDWYRAMLTDPSTKSDVDYLSTAGQAGWCEAVGVTDFKVVCAALTTGEVRPRVEYRRN